MPVTDFFVVHWNNVDARLNTTISVGGIRPAKIRPQVDPGNLGRIVAIDIETGEFALDDDTKSACNQVFARIPDAQIFCIRIVYRSVHQFGAQSGKLPYAKS